MGLIVFFLVTSFLLVQHPFITYPLSLYFIMRIRGETTVRKVSNTELASVDIVFCAYNEGTSVKQKIENCLSFKASAPSVEVRAYSDGSSDCTSEILGSHASQLDVTISDRRLGKSAGMNALLARSDAEIVVFTDANTTIDCKAIEAVRRYFADPVVGCVCGNLLYTNSDESATASIGCLYWRLEQLIKNLETSTGSTMGADGALFAIRRKLFREIPVDIIDDMFTSLSILCDGYRVVQADDFIAYERSVTRSTEEFRRKMRIACRAFNCNRLLWPRLRRTGPLNVYKYISHKWVRWLSGLWILTFGIHSLLLLSLSGAWWVTALAVAQAAAICAAGKVNFSSAARSLNEVLISFFAATFGVWKSLRGERNQTWSVAVTARVGNELYEWPDGKEKKAA